MHHNEIKIIIAFFIHEATITVKSVRAVLFLVPIFGLQFLLLPIRPSRGSQFEYGYEIISSISTSTQGLAVSVLLCFSNHEVLSLIKTYFKKLKLNCRMELEYFLEHLTKKVFQHQI